jgi:carbonic anhydrase/acetyltransferase-like protein (isoleucine patch superfamily)
MDDAIVGQHSIIGAMTFVKAKMSIPPKSLVVGNPGKIIRTVSDDMIDWKKKGTALYQTLPADCHASLHPTLPLKDIPDHRPNQEVLFDTWEKIKSTK